MQKKFSKINNMNTILRPRITEKAGISNDASNVYTFEVTQNSTKHSVAHEIKTLYKVTPLKVNIVNLPARKVVVRGKKGEQSAVKKALVYLKKGDKINLA